jgi:hypothetical protein
VLVQSRGLLEELLVLLAALGRADHDVVVAEQLAECHFDAGSSALVDVDEHEAAIQRNDHVCNRPKRMTLRNVDIMGELLWSLVA